MEEASLSPTGSDLIARVFREVSDHQHPTGSYSHNPFLPGSHQERAAPEEEDPPPNESGPPPLVAGSSNPSNSRRWSIVCVIYETPRVLYPSGGRYHQQRYQWWTVPSAALPAVDGTISSVTRPGPQDSLNEKSLS